MTITKRAEKGTALTYDEMDENFRDLREDTDIDRVLENGNTTTRDLTVGNVSANSLSVTNYRPGQIIEQIATKCSGETIEVISGTYTPENVTTTQALTTTPTAVTGSTFAYTPPAGTKKVVYNFEYKFDVTQNSGISHHILHIDGVEVIPTARTYASNYASTDWNHANLSICINHVVDLTVGTDDASNGNFASWTSPKTFAVVSREYNGSYESVMHSNTWWNGTGASAPYNFTKPFLTITAIA